jgi:hypothetical protein
MDTWEVRVRSLENVKDAHEKTIAAHEKTIAAHEMRSMV